MALLDIVIDLLNINCSSVQCSGYGSDIEALFYLLFFPTVFIILFVFVVVGAVLDKTGGKEGGLRILISVALYAFIIFEGYYNLFVSLSKLWWLLLATLVGVWIFIRQFIHGGGGGSEGGSYGGVGGRAMRGITDSIKEKGERITPETNIFILKRAKGYSEAARVELGALSNKVGEYLEMSPRDKTEFEKTLHQQENRTKDAIDELDDYTDKYKGLKKKYEDMVENYRKELEILKNREKLKKAA